MRLSPLLPLPLSSEDPSPYHRFLPVAGPRETTSPLRIDHSVIMRPDTCGPVNAKPAERLSR